MEPSTNTQPLSPVLCLTHNDLLDRMKTLPRLNLEEDKLIPARRYTLAGYTLGLREIIPPRASRVQLKRAAPIGLPPLVMREGHVKDVRDAAGADDVVVVEEVTAFGVCVHGHVLLRARERTAACHGPHEGAELGRVERVAEGEEVGEERDLVFGEVVERGEVTSLVDLGVSEPAFKDEQFECHYVGR